MTEIRYKVDFPELGSEVKIRDTELTGRVVERRWSATSRETAVGVRVGSEHYIVPLALIEVLSPPLPPEPPEGSWARFRVDGGWRYVQRVADGWYRDGNVLYLPSSWEDIASLNPEVLAEQPQEKYERAADANSLAMWRHKCGNVTGWNPGVNPDTQMCPHCSKRGDWQQLYVKADSDGAEQPQEKYERAGSASFHHWLHSCGEVTRLDLHVNPNAGGLTHRWCSDERCNDRGGYVPLYVKADSDG